MPFPAALSSGNYDSLRGTASVPPSYWAAQFLTLCPNNVVLACRVNGTPTGNSYAQFNFDTVTTGAYTDVIADMRIIISHTNSQRAAFFDGRARVVPTSSILYINETSAPITDNDYVWVIDDYRLLDRLPAFQGGVQYKDWNISFRRLLPYVRGLQSAYVGWIGDPADGTTKLRIAFSITATAEDSGASISYLWTFPGTATVISGSTTAAAVTIDFAHSAGNWCHLKVTDSNGNTITRHFFVHPASDTYPPLLTASGLSISGSIDQGWNATVEAWSGVSSILDQTLAVAWDEEYYNGTKTSILSNVKFVGRFRQQSPHTTTDLTYSQLQQVNYQIEGMAAQLARTEVLPHMLLPQASPTQWDEIKNLTLWRAIAYMLSEHSTFTNLCDLEFDDVTDTFLTAQIKTMQGNLLDMVKDLAQSSNSIFEFAPQGGTRIYTDARYLANLARSSLVIVANYTSADWIELTVNQDPPSTTSQVNASGAYYDSSSGVETPLLAVAPGAAQDVGPDPVTLARQYLQANSGVVAAQAQLNQRAAFCLEIQRTKTTLTIRFPDGYNFMVPSLSQWYTFTIDATDNALGLAYTTSTRWLCTSVTVNHDNTSGTKDVTATFTIETNALVSGQTVAYPTTTEIPDFVPDIPLFDPYSMFPEDPSNYILDTATPVDIPAGLAGQGDLTFGGDYVIAGSASQINLLTKFLSAPVPIPINITPVASVLGAYSVRSAILDPFYSLYPNKLPVFSLLSDGTNSKVLDNPDVAAGGADAAWVDNPPLTGDFKVLRGTSAQNGVMIYTPNSASGGGGGPWSLTFDFTTGQHGWVLWGGDMTGSPVGVYTPGVGFEAAPWDAPNNGCAILLSFGNTINMYEIDFTYYLEDDPAGAGRRAQIGRMYPGNYPGFYNFNNFFSPVGSFPNTFTNTYVINETLDWNGISVEVNNQAAVPDGPYRFLSITLKGHNTAPILPSSAYVAYSSDGGATWNAPTSPGATPGSVGGFDTQRAGENWFSAISGGVARGTTLAGTGVLYYSITGGAQCAAVIVPYLNRTNGDNTSVTHPEIIVALTALDASSRSLLRIEGGATPGTVHDITPVAGIVFDKPDCVTILSAYHISVFGKVSGVYKTYETLDGGTTWSLVNSPNAPTFIRCRRNDNSAAVSGSAAGQLFLVESGANVIDYSKVWGTAAMTAKDPSLTTPLFVEPIY